MESDPSAAFSYRAHPRGAGSSAWASSRTSSLATTCLSGRRVTCAELDKGNQGTRHVLHPCGTNQTWSSGLQAGSASASQDRSGYVYQILIGMRRLHGVGEIRSRGIGLVAAALAQSTDHILDFFSMLRLELGFYVGCLNLRDRLSRKREPLCFPVPLALGNAMLSGWGLYDPCLSLTSSRESSAMI